MPEAREIGNNLIIEANIKPKSSIFKIEKKDNYIIYCKSSPEQNKADQEIIKEMKKLTRNQVKIIRGLKSKKKSILLNNITEREFEKMIE